MPDKEGHRNQWAAPEAPWKRTPQLIDGRPEQSVGATFTDPAASTFWKRPGRAGKVYVAGPMTNLAYFNFGAFDQAAEVLRAAGWEVFSPAEHDRDGGLDVNLFPTGDMAHLIASGFDLRQAFQWDLDRIMESDAIALLDGHHNSTGAKAELAVARMIRLRELKFVYDEVTGRIFDYYEVKR